MQPAGADGTDHHARRFGPKAMARDGLPGFELGQGKLRLDSLHGLDEVVDHAVGVGVVDVPAVQLTVGHHVDPGQLLGLEHREDRIAQALAGTEHPQPRGHGIAADDGGFDHGDNHTLQSSTWSPGTREKI